ncbi:hypothetical protein Tco_0917317, partial [Tanacetum coccineum]
LSDKKFSVYVDLFRKILDICPRVPNEEFVAPPSEEDLLTFLIELGYKGPLDHLAKMFFDHMHQPWRTLATIINKQNVDSTELIWTSSSMHTIKDDEVISRLKFVRIGDDFQEYGRAILETMLTKGIKKLKAYQTSIKYSNGLIPLKKIRGKGSQGKMLAITLKPASVVVSDESDPEPAKKQTGSRRNLDEAEEEEVVRRVHATHECLVSESDEPCGEPTNRPTGRRRPSGDGVTPEDPDESTFILTISSEGTGTKLGVPDETDDEKETDDEFMHGDEYAYDDVDEEMKDAEVAKTEKDGEEIADAEKTNVEKTKVTKGDLEQVGKLPITSSSLYSSSILIVPVLVIPEPTFLSPIPETPTVTLVTTFPPPLPVTNISHVLQQQTTLIHTPLITIAAPAVIRVLDPLPAIVQRVSKLEKDVQDLKQVDQSPAIIAKIRSQVPAAVDEYLGSSLGDALHKVLQKHTKELIQQSSQKYFSEIIKIKHEQAAKEKMPTFLATPYDQAAKAEFKRKEIIFKMIRESKSYKKHPKHKALYDALMLLLIQDEDDLDRVVPDMRKRDCEEDEDPSAGSNQGKRKKSSKRTLNPQRQLQHPIKPWKVTLHLNLLKLVNLDLLKSHLKKLLMRGNCGRRPDRQLYKFKEGDFINLHLNDIKDMLLLVVQHKLFHLDGEVIVDLVVALCIMVDLIDKQMLERRILRNLERSNLIIYLVNIVETRRGVE